MNDKANTRIEYSSFLESEEVIASSVRTVGQFFLMDSFWSLIGGRQIDSFKNGAKVSQKSCS